MLKRIGVVGAGTMGRGIVQVLAQSGYEVVMRDLCDKALSGAADSIQKALSKLAEKGKLTEDELKSAMGNIIATTSVDLLKDCDIIIEAASENMEVKKKILKELDDICVEGTILATNTSSLSITELASATNRPSRVIGMHFFNPVPVMKLVEVITGIATADEVKNEVLGLTTNVGKTPVEVKEAPGFVVNRILVPMINEAVGVLADGIAEAKDIDDAMKLGANHPIGPLALGDLIGLDVCLAIMEVLYKEYADAKYRPHPLLRKYVRAGYLGRKTGRGFYEY
jgi:3-hydroxybutyryl-CoA dehydrogenase